MHYLMYKDWGLFERLAQELEQVAKDPLECGPALHKLLTYLEPSLDKSRTAPCFRN